MHVALNHSRRRRGGRESGRPPFCSKRRKTSKIWANSLFIWAAILFILAHDWQKTVAVSRMTFFFFFFLENTYLNLDRKTVQISVKTFFFLFGEHLNLDRNTAQISVKTFFFFFMENTSIWTETPLKFL